MLNMKFAAVIVTYNRLKLLKEVITSFENQTRKPDYMIVVDNASNDGTDIFLQNWEKADVDGIDKMRIRTPQNLGGSGGFFMGTQKAIELDVDWVWVSDDDAIPAKDVFKKAEEHIADCKDINTVSAICTSVYVNGKICTSNRNRRIMKFSHMELQDIENMEYEKEAFNCDNFSYVGVFIKKDVLKKVGLINKDYFIWRDDVEHSWRVSEAGRIICYPDMIVDHRANSNDYAGTSWKTYYGYRNDIIMLRAHKQYIYVMTKVLAALRQALNAKSKAERKMYLRSVISGLKNEKGLSDNYLPGTRIE